jgi:acetyl esterase/lipase
MTLKEFAKVCRRASSGSATSALFIATLFTHSPALASAPEANNMQVLPEQMQSADRHRFPRERLRPDSTLTDLLDHPAFDGFADRLLPWDDRRYDRGLALRQMATLLPYHSAVVPDVIVAGLNALIDRANRGEKIFYDIYDDEEKERDPSKRNTGLFFLRGKPGAPFAIISPGGGFAYVGSVHEGFPYATDISDHGYNAFVLKYRVGQGGRIATEDLARALSFVFSHAAELGVSTKHYSLWGSSAGARMAASIGSHGAAAFGGSLLPAPSTVVIAYTAHADYGAHEPPTFVVVGDNDVIAPPKVMEGRIEALRRQGTTVGYRHYTGVGHGFGSGRGTSADGWIDDALHFWNMATTRKER